MQCSAGLAVCFADVDSINFLELANLILRQVQLEMHRMQCRKSERVKLISSLIKDAESQARAMQDGSNTSLTPKALSKIKEKFAQITLLQKCVKRDIAVLKSLAFRNSVARHDAIPEAHKQTFSWVFSDAANANTSSSLMNWLENGEGIFWVSGKPGAGKSTLMKYIADHNKTREALARWSAPKPAVLVSHYFWCAGTHMQRSHYGLLRTLLFEILCQFPDMVETWLPGQLETTTTSSQSWSIDELTHTLVRITSEADLPAKLCIFIDGLDEFEGDHFKLCRQLMQLAESGNAKLCLSSRPWGVFTQAFGDGAVPQLCLQDVTRGDILAYAQNQLLQHCHSGRLREDRALALAEQITDMSQGVFLWVSLVMKLLLNKLAMNASVDLEQELDKCPSDLDDFFTFSLGNVKHDEVPKMATSLLIAVEAEKPLDIGIYYFHDMEYNNKDYVFALSAEPPSRQEHRQRLANTTQRLENRCQDLLHFDKATNVVNFLHRTARDYLHLAGTKEMLTAKAPAGFRARLCLVRAFTAWLKTSRASKSEEPRAGFMSGTKSVLDAAGRIQCQGDDEVVRGLLDGLDKSLVDKGPSAEENLQFLRQEVIRHRLSLYLCGIQDRIPGYLKLLSVPPLVVALGLDYESGGQRQQTWDTATAKTAACLLQQGQGPNQSYSTAETLAENGENTPWLLFCGHILPHAEDYRLTTGKVRPHFKAALESGILNLFLKNGADVNAVCKRPGKSSSHVAMDYLFHCFAVATLGDLTIQEMYLEHLGLFLDIDSAQWGIRSTAFNESLTRGFKESGYWEFLTRVTEVVASGGDLN